MSTCVRVIAALLPILAGCASVSGIGGASSYGCQAPAGVACESVSGTYSNTAGRRASPAVAHAAPVARSAPAAARPASAPAATPRTALITLAIRAPGRILRLWVKPWEDSDGDLHEEGHVHVQVDGGRWLLDHVHRQIREAYAPIRPPQRLLGSDGSKDSPAPRFAPAAGPEATPGNTPGPFRPGGPAPALPSD